MVALALPCLLLFWTIVALYKEQKPSPASHELRRNSRCCKWIKLTLQRGIFHLLTPAAIIIFFHIMVPPKEPFVLCFMSCFFGLSGKKAVKMLPMDFSNCLSSSRFGQILTGAMERLEMTIKEHWTSTGRKFEFLPLFLPMLVQQFIHSWRKNASPIPGFFLAQNGPFGAGYARQHCQST